MSSSSGCCCCGSVSADDALGCWATYVMYSLRRRMKSCLAPRRFASYLRASMESPYRRDLSSSDRSSSSPRVTVAIAVAVALT